MARENNGLSTLSICVLAGAGVAIAGIAAACYITHEEEVTRRQCLHLDYQTKKDKLIAKLALFSKGQPCFTD